MKVKKNATVTYHIAVRTKWLPISTQMKNLFWLLHIQQSHFPVTEQLLLAKQCVSCCISGCWIHPVEQKINLFTKLDFTRK